MVCFDDFLQFRTEFENVRHIFSATLISHRRI